MTMTTATATMEMTKLDLWKAEWRDVYNAKLQEILSHEQLNVNMKKAGHHFLNKVDTYMNSILYDLHKIRCIFDELSIEQIMSKGFQFLLSNEYSFKVGIYGDHNCGMIREFDENSQVHFDPFILDDVMMAEFVAGTGDNEPYFYLNIRIYEDDSERIDFDFEYEDLEDIERFKESQALFGNNLLSVISNEDEDEDDKEENDGEPVDNELLEKLSEMKFNELKNALRWNNAFDSIKLQKYIDEYGEFTYYIQIYDKTLSHTTITCDKIGWKIHWGSSTPVSLRTLIDKVMDNN